MRLFAPGRVSSSALQTFVVEILGIPIGAVLEVPIPVNAFPVKLLPNQVISHGAKRVVVANRLQAERVPERPFLRILDGTGNVHTDLS